MPKPPYAIHRLSAGFTLIELLVVMSIIAILASMAAPSFNDLIANQRLTTAANAFITDLQFARSESAKRNATVTLCPSADSSTCTNSWLDGRIVFVDANNNGQADGAELIRVSAAPEGLATATVTGFSAATVRVRSTGQTNEVGSIALCDTRSGNVGRTVSVSNVGRPSVAKSNCP